MRICFAFEGVEEREVACSLNGNEGWIEVTEGGGGRRRGEVWVSERTGREEGKKG